MIWASESGSTSESGEVFEEVEVVGLEGVMIVSCCSGCVDIAKILNVVDRESYALHWWQSKEIQVNV